MKDIYVKFDSPAIKGESQDKDHKDWIEINSWSQDIVQPRSATASTAGGHTAERCEHRDMVFTKDLDVVRSSDSFGRYCLVILKRNKAPAHNS